MRNKQKIKIKERRMPHSGSLAHRSVMLGSGINSVQRTNMKTHLVQQQMKTKIIPHILHICRLWRLAQEGSKVKMEL